MLGKAGDKRTFAKIAGVTSTISKPNLAQTAKRDIHIALRNLNDCCVTNAESARGEMTKFFFGNESYDSFGSQCSEPVEPGKLEVPGSGQRLKAEDDIPPDVLAAQHLASAPPQSLRGVIAGAQGLAHNPLPYKRQHALRQRLLELELQAARTLEGVRRLAVESCTTPLYEDDCDLLTDGNEEDAEELEFQTSVDLVVDIPRYKVRLCGTDISTKPPHGLQRQPYFCLAALALRPFRIVSMNGLAADLAALGAPLARHMEPEAYPIRYRILRAFRRALSNHPRASELDKIIETVPCQGLRLNCTALVLRSRDDLIGIDVQQRSRR